MTSSPFPRCDQTPVWGRLRAGYEAHGRALDLREAFASDAGRFAALSWQAPGVFVDLSKSHVDQAVLANLVELAQACAIAPRLQQAMSGALVNETEGRCALHTALRDAPFTPAPVREQVRAQLERMLNFAEQIRSAGKIKHVVNIGIGGSDLGPQLMVQALGVRGAALQLHFVSSLDAQDLLQTLSVCRPEDTMFVVSSKTFTTQETMANARLAQQWFAEQGGQDLNAHFVAITTDPALAKKQGFTQIFQFWNWVGGRFSLWSSIGLPVALAIGADEFRALLEGARAMDEHAATAPVVANVPILLGLLDLWYRNFMGYTSRCVAPYAFGLRRLPAYLQQLVMESNGKSVDMAGQTLPFATSDVVWGEPGTNGQHAFFQMLHQGSDVIPVEFVLVQEARVDAASSQEQQQMVLRQHQAMLANGLAQAQALMQGRTPAQALADGFQPSATSPLDAPTLAQHRSLSGNRPSMSFLIERLDARSLGALISLYEHRVAVAGALWGINSFDQWGVELGKTMGLDILQRMQQGQTQGLDTSTAAWVQRLQS